MAIRNIKLVIHYDGTRFCGWAAQPGRDTIQGKIEEAFAKLIGTSVNINGSSRTDAGVHALGQVANVKINSPIPTENLQKALNNLLPEDIVIAGVEEANEVFDAIRDTQSKRYRYTIYTAPLRPIFTIHHCWHYPYLLDSEKMKQAAGFLIGTRDFKSFASAGDHRQSSVRTLLRCDVTGDSERIYVDVEADGFLYNMVRNIVGTLVEIGRGRRQPGEIEKILEAKDRTAAGPIAPAAGLCLMEIHY